MKFGDCLNTFLQVADKNKLAVAAWKMPNDPEQKIILGTCSDVEVDIFSGKFKGFAVAQFDTDLPGNKTFINELVSFKSGNEGFTIPDNSNADLIRDLHKYRYEGVKYKLSNLNNKINQSSTSKNTYTRMVDSIVGKIQKNEIQKVIVSGRKFIPLSSDFDFGVVWKHLCNRYPEAFINLVYLPGNELWIGVSPELLISTAGDKIRTVALAGTLNGRPGRSVEWNSKNKHEQEIVSKYIEKCFIQAGIENYKVLGTRTIFTGKLKHLQTNFIAPMLKNVSKINPLLDLLHPSPAICGTPRDKARQLIKEMEKTPRNYYAGYLGPVGYENSVNLFVNLRCMQVGQSGASLYAGAGIVENSNPEEEWLEIRLKFDTLMDVVLPFVASK